MKRPAQRSLLAAALVTACIGLVGLSTLGTATAQGAGPEGSGTPRPQVHGHGHVMGRHAHPAQTDGKHHAQHREQRRTEHLNQLKTALKLTPAQETAWLAYVARTAPQAQTQDKPSKTAAASADKAFLTTPQRLDQLLAFKAERDTRMLRHIDATRQMYAALSPDQQKVFDTQALHHGTHRMGMGMGMGMGGHMKGEQPQHRGTHPQHGHHPLSKDSNGMAERSAGTSNEKI